MDQIMQPAETPTVSVVTPFFNEGPAVDAYFRAVIPVLEGIAEATFEIVCVNDGSYDDTLYRLQSYAARDVRIIVIDLSRNFGKEAALTAGIDFSLGCAVIPFDADLQDPPSVIPKLVECWRAGNEVVLARRVNRDADSIAKRWSAAAFYRLHNMVSRPALPENVGDFRLIN